MRVDTPGISLRCGVCKEPRTIFVALVYRRLTKVRLDCHYILGSNTCVGSGRMGRDVRILLRMYLSHVFPIVATPVQYPDIEFPKYTTSISFPSLSRLLSTFPPKPTPRLTGHLLPCMQGSRLSLV